MLYSSIGLRLLPISGFEYIPDNREDIGGITVIDNTVCATVQSRELLPDMLGLRSENPPD